MSETELQTDGRLPDEVKRIIENECRWDDNEPNVNVRDFEIKHRSLSDIAANTDGKEIGDWIREGKQVKILPLVITSNIYILAILAALSTTLSSLIEEDKIEIDFLVGKELIKHSEKFIQPPFNENYRRIIPDCYDHNLTTMIEINFSELKSLLNILIASLEIERADIRKIIKRVNHTDIRDYCRENVKRDKSIEQTITKWTSKRRDALSNSVMDERVLEVALNKNYNIIDELLKIVVSFLQSTDTGSGDKLILIVATPVKVSIELFFTEKMNELNLDNGRLDDIMFVSYTDPTDAKDPEVIVKSIPSYLTILSKYLNSQKNLYAIDEYFHSKMIDATKSRRFQCEKFHEEIISEMKEKDPYLEDGSIEKLLEEYAKKKNKAIKNLSAAPNNKDIEKYIKKQRKELEVINDGFLTVQNDILEQLKLIL